MIKNESGTVTEQLYLEEQCGCGKPAKYMSKNGHGSCNKYSRCPSYDDLTQTNKKLENDFSTLLNEVQSVLVYREGTTHYEEAVAHIKVIAQKNGFELEI